MLTKWIEEDIPWTDHAVWFPWCVFVCHIKGEKFIRECQQKIIEAPYIEHKIPKTVY